ncbi:hypothetical protein BU25DRAFT_380409 [Macroventuria anomochaeta]|uniref:Uncharacterized protein n=1 Tax=Macroventuria anomochaeta TaxID=301207 RepID=A0ACB6SJ49_9PLEO|nr:uncharacterized protein BU25DRAFT_380409 [Macroventuria anomochaeta]KAF2633217.1 hypothetical protein BU25DRAFT_380409 [Macroventuria anomochaeta]
MDPRYNHQYGYPNGSNAQYPPQQPQNGYQQYGQAPQYPQQYQQQYPPAQMQMHHGYPQQPQQRQSQVVIPRPQSQQYMPMPQHQQPYSPQQQQASQSQPRPQPQPQSRAQPQVMIPQQAPSSIPYPQMSSPQTPSPNIRQAQVPVQRASNAGVSQVDGAKDMYRRQSAQQIPTPPMSKPVQRTVPRPESMQRPQQMPPSTPVQVQVQQQWPVQTTPTQQTPSQQTSSQQTSSQQTSSQPRSHPKVVIPRPPSHQLTSPTKAAHTQLPQKALPADLSVMLLSAADEYITAARGMGSIIARQKKNGDVQQYYKLMSTAMGCMDAVLRKYNMQPRDEAKLRLRYASLLIEETDNTAEIDEILSKGISLCARCRLQDLRYSMLHLQARYQFQTNHRAAFKALDKDISEAETFQQIAWVYAFRFLKVSLLLQSTDRIEAIPALQQLHAINAYAERRGDTAIAFACNTLEAMVHLRSSAQDRLTEAQRAIAQARSLQLTMSAKQQGSFGTLFSVIDLACSVHQNAPDTAKSTALIQATADENDNSLGTEDGFFTVLLDRTSGGSLTTDTGGIFRKNDEGRDELMFTWLPREDVKALCFHICALDQSVHEKALQLVQEARSRTNDSLRKQSPYGLPISTACAQTQWRKILDWHATFTLGLIATHREQQSTANDALNSLTRRVASPPYANQQNYTQSLSYLEAITDQTNGRFNAALATYSSSAYAFTDKGHAPTLTSDLGILAAFNRLLIARDPAHPDHKNVGTLLVQLRLACEEHPSQYVRMAFTLVNALSTLDPSINRLKTLMNNATQKSHDLFKRTHNREFVVMSLCYFTARFFIEPITDKSSSAANAVRQHAKQSNRPLWMAVACGLMIKVFEHHNSVAEKQKYEEIYEKVRVKLPAPLRGDDVDAEGEDDDEDINLVG